MYHFDIPAPKVKVTVQGERSNWAKCYFVSALTSSSLQIRHTYKSTNTSWNSPICYWQAATDEKRSGLACSSQDVYYGMIAEPVTVIHPLHGGSDHKGLTRTLQEVQPRYVVLYDADMQFVRELEVHNVLLFTFQDK